MLKKILTTNSSVISLSMSNTDSPRVTHTHTSPLSPQRSGIKILVLGSTKRQSVAPFRSYLIGHRLVNRPVTNWSTGRSLIGQQACHPDQELHLPFSIHWTKGHRSKCLPVSPLMYTAGGRCDCGFMGTCTRRHDWRLIKNKQLVYVKTLKNWNTVRIGDTTKHQTIFML